MAEKAANRGGGVYSWKKRAANAIKPVDETAS